MSHKTLKTNGLPSYVFSESSRKNPLLQHSENRKNIQLSLLDYIHVDVDINVLNNIKVNDHENLTQGLINTQTFHSGNLKKIFKTATQ